MRAVGRNLIRRRVYEIIRKNLAHVPSGYVCILHIKPGQKSYETVVLEEELMSLFKKSLI
jgi:ribonuclease P protein component